ncbi:MAG: DUF4932 domain-containing protein, partial [Elusimicrobia bacterium]|nr:DUF4932 domain-containing protein [Elusimicrobiota bacterium]
MSRLLAALLAAFLAQFAGAARARRPEVRLDPRVELSAALHLLASAPRRPLPGFRDDGGAYARLLSSATAAERGHPAVAAYARAFARPTPGGYSFMTPAHELRRCLDDSLRLRTDVPDCRRSSLAFAAADFAARTRFAALMPRLAALEARPLKALRRGRARADLQSVYEKYSGLKTVRQRIAPSPLLESGRVWNDYAAPEGGRPARILTVISPDVAGSSGPAVFSWGPVMTNVWHEQSHALLNAAADAADAADGPPPPGAPPSCYGSWTQCVREHVAQGTALRLVQIARRTGYPPDAPDAATNERLPWQALVADWLRDGYEGHRDRYKTLRDFVPVIVRRLRAQAALLPPRPGPPATEAQAGAAR